MQNVCLDSARAARRFPCGEIDKRVCAACGFVFNAAFDPKRVAYAPGYENTQSYSPAFSRYLMQAAAKLRDHLGVKGARIVDIGCGTGALLQELVGDPRYRNHGTGFDPAYRGPATRFSGRARFHRRLFGERPERLSADVIVCRQVIEHLPDPVGFLKRLRDSIGVTAPVRMFFETSCAEWILRNRVLHDIYYEHCSLFSPESYRTAFRMAGYRVSRTWHGFRGAYLWIEAAPAVTIRKPRLLGRPATALLAAGFHRAELDWARYWSALLHPPRGGGAIVVWGAGAKGVTFTNLADARCKRIHCLVDVNPAKQGRFLPGTGHRIIAPEALRGIRLGRVVVMNAVYFEEIRATLKALGLTPELVRA